MKMMKNGLGLGLIQRIDNEPTNMRHTCVDGCVWGCTSAQIGTQTCVCVFHIILYVNCFGRTVLYMFIEYHI